MTDTPTFTGRLTFPATDTTDIVQRLRRTPMVAHNTVCLVMDEAADTIESQAARIAELEKDEVRLDWLADKSQSIGNVQLPTKHVLANLHSLRDAIDAAMGS